MFLGFFQTDFSALMQSTCICVHWLMLLFFILLFIASVLSVIIINIFKIESYMPCTDVQFVAVFPPELMLTFEQSNGR